MTPWLLWAILALLALLLIVDIVGIIQQSYFRASPKVRAGLADETLYHYVPRKHLIHSDGAVTVAVQRKFYVTGIGPGRTVTAAYLYVGRNGRGAWLNHCGRKRRQVDYACVAIRGQDFVAWLGNRPLKYRSWDRAVMIQDSYTGPGTVTYGTHPFTDRKLRHTSVKS